MEPEQIDRRLAEILARPEFAELHRGSGAELRLIGELFESIFATLQALLGGLRAEHPGIFVLLLILGTGVLLLAVYLGARGAARRARGDARLGGELPELLRGDPAQLRLEAAREAEALRWRAAVRLLFRAALIEQALAEGTLARRRDAEGFRRARTYRELVAEFARPDPRGAEMQRLAQRLEQALYAGLELGRSDWQAVQRFAGEGR